MTQQTATGAKIAGGAPQTLAGGSGVFALTPGMSFMDLIFARSTASGNVDPGASAQTGVDIQAQVQIQPLLAQLAQKLTGETASSPEPLTAEQMMEMLLQADPAALEGIATAEEMAALQAQFASVPVMPAPGNPGQPSLAEIKKKLEALLESLLAGLPRENRQLTFEITEDGTILVQKPGETEASPALIATGLTPEQLTDILKEIADGNEQGDAFVIASVQILPPEANKDAVFLPRGVIVVQQQAANDTAAPQPVDKSGEMAAQLNTLVNGEEGESLPLEENDFEGVLRMFERAQDKTQPSVQAGTEAEKTVRNASAGNSAVQGAPPALAEISTDVAMSSVYPEGFDVATGTVHQLNITGPAQLTSLISHAPQTVYPHPAAQMVASIIAKASVNGESKNITINLDPPDLGKVHVKMELGKDNSVKAHMVIEKQETFLMLQRDAHVLERALQEAGMDTGGGLSFELAQDGNLFSHDDNSGSGNSGGGGDDGVMETAATETIETRMDWYVDPTTGLTRYDALV